MQSDLELLELAAQAIGEQFHSGHLTQNGKQYEWVEWNPLTDDGDALRLAVKLNINVFIYDDETSTGTIGVVGTGWGSKEANTRRAIVRAAAAIGAQAHPDHKD